MHTDPSTPGCPAWRASELPLPQPEDLPEVICAPLARAATWTCRPQAVSAASPSPAKSLARSLDSSASGCTPRQVPPTSPLLRPWRRPPRRPSGHPHPTRGELTRPGVFLRSFSCSPRRLSRGVQPGSLHLPCARPPSSHLRHLLIWWWRGELEMKGAPRQAGKWRAPSAGRGLGRGAPGSGRRGPAGRGPGAPSGCRGEIWEGDREGKSSRKTSTLGAAGSRLCWGRAGVAPGDRANQGSG